MSSSRQACLRLLIIRPRSTALQFSLQNVADMLKVRDRHCICDADAIEFCAVRPHNDPFPPVAVQDCCDDVVCERGSGGVNLPRVREEGAWPCPAPWHRRSYPIAEEDAIRCQAILWPVPGIGRHAGFCEGECTVIDAHEKTT